MSLGIVSYRPSVLAKTHMVSSGHYLATAAGYRILEQGGNAIDAGVASGIVINVTLPHMTCFGGVAPIMVYVAEAKKAFTISGLGRWPKGAPVETFNGEMPARLGPRRSTGGLRCLAYGTGELRHYDFQAGCHSCSGTGRKRISYLQKGRGRYLRSRRKAVRMAAVCQCIHAKRCPTGPRREACES